MRKGWLILLIVFAVIGLATTALFGLTALGLTRAAAAGFFQEGGWGWMPMMGGYTRGGTQSGCAGGGWSGMMGANGMMGGFRSGNAGSGVCPYLEDGQPTQATGERLSSQQALDEAQAFIADDPNLEVSEVMQFEDNFYAVVVEVDSGRGAMELLVDPYSGSVFPEYGPNMMWNQKYGHMGRWFSGNDQLSLEEAEAAAQRWLDDELPGAEVEGMGIDFHGYFTFDYALDGRTAGMLSVNAASQDVWLHTWHGEFIDEIELDE